MGPHIKPEGWHNWNKPESEETSYYAEWESSGPGANKDQRVSWSHQLSQEALSRYSPDKIFNDWEKFSRGQ